MKKYVVFFIAALSIVPQSQVNAGTTSQERPVIYEANNKKWYAIKPSKAQHLGEQLKKFFPTSFNSLFYDESTGIYYIPIQSWPNGLAISYFCQLEEVQQQPNIPYLNDDTELPGEDGW